MATTATSGTSGMGVDVNAIVTGLMSIERQPITKLDAKEASQQSKLTALGTLKSKMAALQTAAQNLGSGSSSSLVSLKATASDASTLSATASSTAVAGAYSLSISSLAQSQMLVSAGQSSSSSAIGDGTPTTVTFDLGTISGGTLAAGIYSGASFTSNGGPQSITIDSTNNTLQGIRDAINNAGLGISATLVNDGSGTPYRLALSSNNTGVDQSLKISTSGGDGSLDTLLAHDPAGLPAAQHLNQTVAAQNAVFEVNGVPISKTSNTVTDAIEGVSLTLSKVTTTPVTLTLSRDTTAVTDSVTKFVTAYNDLYTSMRNMYAYKSGSALSGDSTIRGLQIQMREIAGTAASSGTLTNLFDVGLSFNKEGVMQQDNTKLSTAISTGFADVATLFNGTTGFATRFQTWTTSALAYDGTFANRTEGINKSLKDISTQRTALEARMASLEQLYRRQYTSLNVALTNLNQTTTYLSQQLSRLN